MTPATPLGNRPSGVTKLLNRGAAGCSADNGVKPKIAMPPKTMSATIATTLISENQNSVSPKTRAEVALMANSTDAKIRHQTHTSTPGNQRCIRMPDAVNSEPSATTQHSQYSQAVVK